MDWDKQGFYFDEVKGGLYPKLLTENLLERSEKVAGKRLTSENNDTKNKNDSKMLTTSEISTSNGISASQAKRVASKGRSSEEHKDLLQEVFQKKTVTFQRSM